MGYLKGDSVNISDAFESYGKWRTVWYLPAIAGVEGTDVADSANTMSSALEVLGLSLPYSSSTPATYAGAPCKLIPELRFT